jgi:hypothetical protein
MANLPRQGKHGTVMPQRKFNRSIETASRTQE